MLADGAIVPQPVSYSPMDAISSPSGSMARTKKIRMACYPVGGNARKIPTAVLDSVGQVYRQPIATIRDINLRFKITQKSKAIGDESCFRVTTNRIRFGASCFQRNANLCCDKI
jgi:hypothetical protein